jgi:hypothetical protein
MTNKTLAFTALNTFADSRADLIRDMGKAGYTTLELCRPVVIEWACGKTGGKFTTSESGKVMLDSKHPKYESTKTVVRDIMLMLQGTTRRASSAKRETKDPIVLLAEKLAELTKADQKRCLRLAGLL